MRQHDKIINMAAKKVLNSHGLFRKGTSRTWLDDNGYFMIFVVFDASNWSQGSYLGVGIDFLWEKWEGLNDTFAYDYGSRGNEFCKYTGNDIAFQTKMEKFAEQGLQKVMEYRSFREMDYAQKCLWQSLSDTPEKQRFWEIYHFAMLCFLMGDFENGARSFDTFLETLKEGFHIDWHEAFYKHCIQHIKPFLSSKEAAQQMVLEMINRRRKLLSSKSSLQKMKKEELHKSSVSNNSSNTKYSLGFFS